MFFKLLSQFETYWQMFLVKSFKTPVNIFRPPACQQRNKVIVTVISAAKHSSCFTEPVKAEFNFMDQLSV